MIEDSLSKHWVDRAARRDRPGTGELVVDGFAACGEGNRMAGREWPRSASGLLRGVPCQGRSKPNAPKAALEKALRSLRSADQAPLSDPCVKGQVSAVHRPCVSETVETLRGWFPAVGGLTPNRRLAQSRQFSRHRRQGSCGTVQPKSRYAVDSEASEIRAIVAHQPVADRPRGHAGRSGGVLALRPASDRRFWGTCKPGRWTVTARILCSYCASNTT